MYKKNENYKKYTMSLINFTSFLQLYTMLSPFLLEKGVGINWVVFNH